MISFVADFGLQKLAGKAVPQVGWKIKVRSSRGSAWACLLRLRTLAPGLACQARVQCTLLTAS